MIKPAPWGEAIRSANACSFDLSSAEVHVWKVTGPAPEAVDSRLYALLSPDERDRAARFGLEQMRHTFVSARAALRYLLGRYLNFNPAALRFSYGPHGKPAIDRAGIEFNMTHSSGLIACAFARGCDIGIDIERIRPGTRTAEIASRFLSPDDVAKINALPPHEQEAAFFHFWTRKEAYIKATGAGLSGINETAGADWTLHDLSAPPGYAGAIAYHSTVREVIVQEQKLELTWRSSW